jgi:hypothetical protein
MRMKINIPGIAGTIDSFSDNLILRFILPLDFIANKYRTTELSPLIRTDYAAHLASYSAGQQ